MNSEIIQQFAKIKERINEVSRKLDNCATEQHKNSIENINEAAISLTDIEIAEIEQAQMLTDHDIAIIELQQKIGG